MRTVVPGPDQAGPNDEPATYSNEEMFAGFTDWRQDEPNIAGNETPMDPSLLALGWTDSFVPMADAYRFPPGWRSSRFSTVGMAQANNPSELDPRYKGGVVVIGKFDGVHRGHQALIAEAAQQAQEHDVPLVVITFEPHPTRVFKPDAPPFRIDTAMGRARRMAALGVDALVALPFDIRLINQSAADFIKNVLVDGLACKRVVVGADFRFGAKRGGSLETLQEAGARHGFDVTGLPPIAIRGTTAGSTLVRTLISEGKVRDAAALLGRWWEVEGHCVAPGDGTLVLALGDLIAPAEGFYAVRVASADPDAPPWHGCRAKLSQLGVKRSNLTLIYLRPETISALTNTAIRVAFTDSHGPSA
ncbi:MAG: adenylyltransferase/cytidyltransferase family protein [Pseudomonadota bacterium]